jgi:hypothetical protein
MQHSFNFDVEQLRFALCILPGGGAVFPFQGDPIESHNKDYEHYKGSHWLIVDPIQRGLGFVGREQNLQQPNGKDQQQERG